MRIITAFGVLCAAWLTFSAVGRAAPGEKSHRVVFQLISSGDDQWEAVLGNVEHLREALGPDSTQVAVVAHSKGLGIMIAADNSHAQRMKKLADQGVEFLACENTMKKKNVTRDQLLPFVQTVDSGVAEVVRKQEQGWSYIKAGM